MPIIIQPRPDVVIKKKETKIIRKSRVGLFGEKFIDRRLISETIFYPFEPEWSFKPNGKEELSQGSSSSLKGKPLLI
jgi:hypothetical protein